MRQGSRYLGWILAGSFALLFSAISPVTGHTTAAGNYTDYNATTTSSGNLVSYNSTNGNTSSSPVGGNGVTSGSGSGSGGGGGGDGGNGGSSSVTSATTPSGTGGANFHQVTTGSSAPTPSPLMTTTPAPSNSNVSTTPAPTPIWCRQCNATNNCTWPDTNNATTECWSTSGICYVLLNQTNVTNHIMSLSCNPSKSTPNTCSSDVIGTPTNVGAFYEFCCKKPDCNDDKTMAELDALCIPSTGKSGAGRLQVGWSLGQVSLVLAITLALTSVFHG